MSLEVSRAVEGLGLGGPPERAGADAAGAAAPRPAAPRRVLVVDDNRDAAEALAMLLSRSGHAVETAHDGPAALAAAAAFRPDAVLLDIGLPGLDGYEVCRRLRRSRGEGLLVVAITGYGQGSDAEASRRAGFDHHLVKPVDVRRLEELVAAAPSGVA